MAAGASTVTGRSVQNRAAVVARNANEAALSQYRRTAAATVPEALLRKALVTLSLVQFTAPGAPTGTGLREPQNAEVANGNECELVQIRHLLMGVATVAASLLKRALVTISIVKVSSLSCKIPFSI